jgi:hypothetical protein
MKNPKPATHLCSYKDMGDPSKEKVGWLGGRFSAVAGDSSSTGNDKLCAAARNALMRCSTSGDRNGYAAGMPHWDIRGLIDSEKAPLDFPSVEAYKMNRVDLRQKFITSLMNPQEQQGIEALVEPFYNPVWTPQFTQREPNLNYAPAHMCPCIKPFFAENNDKACKAIRLYDGTGLAGQMCNARVVGWGELPATYKQTYICCDKWTTLFSGLVKLKYCNKGDGSEPTMTVSAKIKMSPMKDFINVVYHPPVDAFLGSCNTYVKVLTLGLKYAGPEFRLELKRAAIGQLEDWSFKMQRAATLARYNLYHHNMKEAAHKIRNREMQWELLRADKEEEWRSHYFDQDEEYKTWVTNCCKSPICKIIGFLLPIKVYGMLSTLCLHMITTPMRVAARQKYTKKYGMFKEPPPYNIMTLLAPVMKFLPGGRRLLEKQSDESTDAEHRRSPLGDSSSANRIDFQKLWSHQYAKVLQSSVSDDEQ